MRTPTALILLALALFLVPPQTGAQGDNVVEVEATDGLVFDPETITVQPGTTVRWVNTGNAFHTVTETDSKEDGQRSHNGGFEESLGGGATVEITFDEVGTVHYFCQPHSGDGMVGTVIVSEDATGNTGGDNEEAHGESAPGPGLVALLVGIAGLLLVARRK